MAIKLCLKFKEAVIKDYEFDKPMITIGRHPDNDIAIDNMAVSGHHAKIDLIGGDYYVTDLKSLNGTFVNERRVVSSKLMHNDRVLVGKHEIVFINEAQKDFSAAGAAQEEQLLGKTMVLDTASYQELLAKNVPADGAPGAAGATAAPVPEKVGVLTYVGGTGGEIELSKKIMKLGKAGDADVHVGGLFVAPIAATISRRPSGYTIAFNGGLAKLRVNGETVRESALLKEFDTIEIGSAKLQFYYKS